MSPAASIRFRAGIGGEPVMQELQGSEAMTFQPTPWGSWLVTSAAHPVPGDRHSLRVTVGVGCCAEVRSLAATVAHPDPACPAGDTPEPSSTTVHAGVASDALLAWALEPGLSTERCDHRFDAVVQLASSARLLWRDEFVVERRSDGAPGVWRSRLRVTRDGWPVVSTETAVGPGFPLWSSPAVLDGARAVSLMVVVDPGQGLDDWSSARTTLGSATGVALPLSAPGVQIMAWGDDLQECRAAIKEMLPACGVPAWAAERWDSRRAFEGAAAAGAGPGTGFGVPGPGLGRPGGPDMELVAGAFGWGAAAAAAADLGAFGSPGGAPGPAVDLDAFAPPGGNGGWGPAGGNGGWGPPAGEAAGEFGAGFGGAGRGGAGAALP